MPTEKISAARVLAACPRGSFYIIWDELVVGLGLKVHPSGAKSWVLRYRTEDGTQRTLKIADGTSLAPADARKVARKQLARVALGGDPLAERRAARASSHESAAPSFAAVAQMFIDDHARPKRKRATADEYQRKLEKDIPPALAATPIDQIARAQLETLHASRKATPVAANRLLKFVSAVLSFAEKRELRPLHSNIAQLVERYPEKSRERFLTAEEVAAVGRALSVIETREPRTATACDAIRFLLLSGMRRNEVFGLRWSEVDFEHQLAHLPDSKTGSKAVQLGERGTEFLRRRRERMLKGLKRGQALDYVFPSHRNPSSRIVDIKKTLAKVIEEAGVEPFVLHDLRRSFGSTGAAAGHSLQVIGAMLHQKTPSVTSVYARLQKDHVSAAVDDVQERIAAALQAGREG